MPTEAREIPDHEWVWELKERLETAHSLVREHTGNAMKRQKLIHDRRTSYEQFEKGDKVYVYFPVKKIGTSSKFTSFWRGPYLILGKLSDVLYKVDCGRNRSEQVIHCDRIRKCKSQVLPNEPDIYTNEDVSNIGETDIMTDEHDDGTDDISSHGRKRKKSIWSKDYLFSIFRSPMAKTKTTA